MNRTLIRSTAGAAALLAVTLAGAPSALAAPGTQVSSCGTTSARPAQLVLACADANSLLVKIDWTSWTNGSAKASATYQENDCEPTCAAGTLRSYDAELQLGNPRRVNGQRLFTKVTVTFPDGGPGGVSKLTLPLGTSAL